MITAIIIDDEKSGRETLHFLLKKHFYKQIIALDMAGNINDGVALIEKHNPDLIFLDMEMPNETGLSIVNKFEKISFEIIVTTAFKEYGVDAIKAGVFDYLLKPIDVDELGLTLNKVEKKLSEKAEQQLLKKVIHQVEGMSSSKQKIPLLVGNNKTIFADANAIVRCEADGNYTKFYFTDGRSELVTKLIKDVEILLADFNFFRAHKSHLINIENIKSFIKTEDEIIMADGSKIPLSRNMKAEFLIKMKI